MLVLPGLPYGYDALTPVLSETTMRTHHDKHHAKYVSTTNELLAKAAAKPESLEELVLTSKAAGDRKLCNNAGQAWNHAFFWSCMAAGQSGPSGLLAGALTDAFGDLAGAKARFVEEGVAHFGSGWVWFIVKGGKVEVATTHDGMTALELDGAPILVCDLWEHAYYLDHKNDREGFLKVWWDQVVNWDFVSRQFAGELWAYPAPTSPTA
jgi:Fe-Mn family superoxide dismutase